MRSKSEISVDAVTGDTESELGPGGGTIEWKGLVGSGLKGGTGIAKGDVLNGLWDEKTGAGSKGRCANEIGQEWKGIGGGGLN